MEIRQGEKRWYNQNVRLLARGRWLKGQVTINPLLPSANVPIPKVLLPPISEKWAKLREKNPKAFQGPTIRYCGYHEVGNLLIVDVVYSDYRLGQILGWLGAAMVPVTSDGVVACQAPVAAIAASIGGGVRVPGCTPPHIRFFQHINKEMQEEFGADVPEENITILGLLETKPPAANHHYSFALKVKIKETFKELKEKWSKAEDKWEGEMLPLPLTKEAVAEKIFGKEFGETSKAALYLVAENELGDIGLEAIV